MTEGDLSAQDKLVDFKRDIQPIFEKNCLECHGPDLDEAGLNLADPETFIDFHEPGDASSSDLFNVLIDEDRIMPPEDSGEPLSVSEIALVKLWIDEGAEVSEDETGS
ncbi:MAG: c-type cytochrome domain-containing protein, partial [Planctomycetota bacterium]|nr:c-type cytochrome domain-containing protein [Planctomycetota bacterium]